MKIEKTFLAQQALAVFPADLADFDYMALTLNWVSIEMIVRLQDEYKEVSTRFYCIYLLAGILQD